MNTFCCCSTWCLLMTVASENSPSPLRNLQKLFHNAFDSSSSGEVKLPVFCALAILRGWPTMHCTILAWRTALLSELYFCVAYRKWLKPLPFGTTSFSNWMLWTFIPVTAALAVLLTLVSYGENSLYSMWRAGSRLTDPSQSDSECPSLTSPHNC